MVRDKWERLRFQLSAFIVFGLETGAEWMPTSVSQWEVEEEEEKYIKASVSEEQQSRF